MDTGDGGSEAAPAAHGAVRISRIDGRFLIFDPDDVARLRRRHGSAVVMTGTVPQQPTQNLFLSLPAELAPAEARTLVDQAVAVIVDDAAVLQARLGALDPATRARYHAALRRSRELAQRVIADKKALHQAAGVPGAPDAAPISPHSGAPEPSCRKAARPPLLDVTLTVDKVLFTPGDAPVVDLPAPSPFLHHLLLAGYYTTPGIRFGTQYSVYPGDPLRFHAHFLANQYDWHQEIAVLDLVGLGRLATGVKKSFMLGASDPEQPTADDGAVAGKVRIFCLEWAAM